MLPLEQLAEIGRYDDRIVYEPVVGVCSLLVVCGEEATAASGIGLLC